MKTKIAFIKAAPLTDVCDRVDYISNPERQRGEKDIKEKLLAFYQTPEDPKFWNKLAKINHRNNLKYNKSDVVVEAREHILQISNGIYDIATSEDHAAIAKRIAEAFKEKHGVDVAVGVHMNDDGTDYHAHIIFAERKIIRADVDRAPATRNTYFDELGRRSNKAACIDANGKLRKGCTLVRKGERFPTETFSAKIEEFATPAWLRSEKERQGRFMTDLCREYGVQEKWIRYNHKTNPHLRLHNLKRGELEWLRAWKETENEKIRAYNRTIDALLKTGEILPEEALEIKQHVYKRIAQRRDFNKILRENRRLEYERNQRIYEIERERFVALRYRDDGKPRGLFEALVILALVVVGFDLDEILGIEKESIELKAPPSTIYVKSLPGTQNYIDDLYRAASKVAPSDLMTNRLTMQGNNSLSDLIAEASAGKRSELPKARAAPEKDLEI